jgi:hypothetical protein
MPSVEGSLPYKFSYGFGFAGPSQQSASPGAGTGLASQVHASIGGYTIAGYLESKTGVGANIGNTPPGNQILRVSAYGQTFENALVINPGPGYAASYAAVRIEIAGFDLLGNQVFRIQGPDIVAFDIRIGVSGIDTRTDEQHILMPVFYLPLPAAPVSLQLWVVAHQSVTSAGLSFAAISNFSFTFDYIDYTFTPV